MSANRASAASEDLLVHLRALADAWIAGDPDPATARELRRMVEEGDIDRLAEHVGEVLTFGTAGLRALVGPGPNRMNRAVVIRTTRGLALHLLRTVPDATRRGVVVGFDARADSEVFARDVVAVLAAAGIETAWFPTPQPTPLVAFAQKTLGAAAAVVVTASHNPSDYNGYKVYGPDAVQIVPPADLEVAASIAAVGPAAEVPREDPEANTLVRTLSSEMGERYLQEITATVPSTPGPALVVAHTPLHGVGGDLVRQALDRAGHGPLHVVASQARPDPRFPTVRFPNPEEPGAMAAVVRLGGEVGADLVLANDPDADRLGVAVARGDGGFHLLTGNQIGVLLADHLLKIGGGERALVVSSIVSTPMVHAVAAAHGARSEVTLTGFKWICSAARELERTEGLRFAYGFEEALGSCVGGIVRDKDGISAAVAFADLARRARHEGHSVLAHLHRLHREHGLWVSHQLAVLRPGARGAEEVRAAMGRLGEHLPAHLAGHEVIGSTDFRVDAERRPPWLGAQELVAIDLPDGRAMIRPSGTEPKCKIYVDLRVELGGRRPADAIGAELLRDARRVGEDLARFVGLA